jgi:hypothetical protein
MNKHPNMKFSSASSVLALIMLTHSGYGDVLNSAQSSFESMHVPFTNNPAAFSPYTRVHMPFRDDLMAGFLPLNVHKYCPTCPNCALLGAESLCTDTLIDSDDMCDIHDNFYESISSTAEMMVPIRTLLEYVSVSENVLTKDILLSWLSDPFSSVQYALYAHFVTDVVEVGNALLVARLRPTVDSVNAHELSQITLQQKMTDQRFTMTNTSVFDQDVLVRMSAKALLLGASTSMVMTASNDNCALAGEWETSARARSGAKRTGTVNETVKQKSPHPTAHQTTDTGNAAPTSDSSESGATANSASTPTNGLYTYTPPIKASTGSEDKAGSSSSTGTGLGSETSVKQILVPPADVSLAGNTGSSYSVGTGRVSETIVPKIRMRLDSNRLSAPTPSDENGQTALPPKQTDAEIKTDETEDGVLNSLYD